MMPGTCTDNSRKLENWLDAYCRYTEETESAAIFHKWVGLSMLAGALRKKTWLSLGRLKVFPNLYIVLVSEPGIARKSQAISWGTEILSEVPSVITSADSITREAMLQDLETCAVDENLADGTVFRHSSLYIISKEFESFLGQKKDNTKMLVLLTDLFDAQEIPWKYRTKNSGSSTIPSVFLNLLAATTPESLASSLPTIAIGGGLTSRIIFVWASERTKRIAFPELTPEIKSLKEKLTTDLNSISRIIGAYKLSDESRAKWEEWYNKYDEKAKNRICKDPSFNGWYSRKPTFIMKLIQVLTAARTNDLIIEWPDFLKAFSLLEEVEHAMVKTFSAIGRSEITADVDIVMSTIQKHGKITEKQLFLMLWRDIDSKKMDNVLATVTRTGKVRREYTATPQGNVITYVWLGS